MSRRRPEDLRRCRNKFRRCLRHPECIEASSKAAHQISPKRLLDLHPRSPERLYTVPKGNHPRYVALSYCWGDVEPVQVKTTTANVRERHDVVDLSPFPKTIQDAVEVCRSLGIHYIWIDALCIVQDDTQDVGSEMAKMRSIYRGAALTIAAASAAKSEDGFLQNRTFEEAYGNLFRVRYRHRQGEDVTEGSIFLSELPISDEYQEPLDKRGWTMQEDLMSLRLLRFGSKQTTWRCPKYPEGISIDGGGTPVKKDEDMGYTIDDWSRNDEVRSKVTEEGAWGSSGIFQAWHNEIERYTFRKLTKPSDRLSACAALAENFSEIMGLNSSDYLAGLWKTHVPAQLLWHRLDGTDIPKHLLWYQSELRSLARCSGPTWSWASLDQPIVFPEHLNYAIDLRGISRTHYVDSQINHEFEQSQYAEVKSGRLDLCGRLQKACWSKPYLRGHTLAYTVLPVEIFWDLVGDDLQKTVWCLEIIGSNVTAGLVLVKTGQTSFERAGYFHTAGKKDHKLIQRWFRMVKPKTISIY